MEILNERRCLSTLIKRILENAQRAHSPPQRAGLSDRITINKLPYIWEIIRTSPGLPTLRAGPGFPASLSEDYGDFAQWGRGCRDLQLTRDESSAREWGQSLNNPIT